MVSDISEWQTVADAAGLATFIAGRSDEDLTASVEAAGTATVLTRIFESMVAAFRPDQAAGHTATVQWEIVAPDGTHTYHTDIDAGTCRVGPGPVDSPRVTLGLDLPVFLRFMAGDIGGMAAFMTGKMRVTGDVMFAPRLEGFFRP